MALLNSKMPPGASRNRSGNFFGSGSSPTHTSELRRLPGRGQLVCKAHRTTSRYSSIMILHAERREVHLDVGLRPLAFHLEDHALAELLVAHARAEPDARAPAPRPARLKRPAATGREIWMRGRTSSIEILGNLRDEARRRAVVVHAVQAALLGVGEIQLLHGARRADVAEAALFFEALGVVDRTLVREQAVFHAAQEHHRELEALGGVQRHHLHAVFPLRAWPSPDSSTACARNDSSGGSFSSSRLPESPRPARSRAPRTPVRSGSRRALRRDRPSLSCGARPARSC